MYLENIKTVKDLKAKFKEDRMGNISSSDAKIILKEIKEAQKWFSLSYVTTLEKNDNGKMSFVQYYINTKYLEDSYSEAKKSVIKSITEHFKNNKSFFLNEKCDLRSYLSEKNDIYYKSIDEFGKTNPYEEDEDFDEDESLNDEFFMDWETYQFELAQETLKNLIKS